MVLIFSDIWVVSYFLEHIEHAPLAVVKIKLLFVLLVLLLLLLLVLLLRYLRIDARHLRIIIHTMWSMTALLVRNFGLRAAS